MESPGAVPIFSDTIDQYDSLLQRKNSCPNFTNPDSVVVNLPFQQPQVFGDASQVSVVPEAIDANTASSQLTADVTTVNGVCVPQTIERDVSSLPNMTELCRTETSRNFRRDSDGTDSAQYPPMSCWQRWWRTVWQTACVQNKTERQFEVHSSLMHRFRCSISSSSGNYCCFGRSRSCRCKCRLAEWPRRRLPNENLLVLSIIQILCGFASIILSSVALTKTVFLYQIAAGMWAGLLMLFTGTQGLITARRPISCTLIGLLIFCLLVTLASCALICISVAGIIEDGFLDRHATKSAGFQYRHFTGLPSKQLPGQHYPDSVDMAMIFHPELHFSQLPMKRINGSNALHWARPRVNYVSRQTRSVDANLRTCQVILHVLLLLVGIMESSVSLSTSAICYKCLYSWYARAYSTRRGTTLDSSGAPFPTSIISFNADTANQAASLLQSRDMREFAQGGGVLLAVAANSQDGIQQDGNNLSLPEASLSRPFVHHTAELFLSERKTRKALILTEAGSVATAWTAVQAAASLLNRDNASVLNDSPSHVDIVGTPHAPSFTSFWSGGSRNRNHRQPSSRDGRPQLLLTSLPSQPRPPSPSDSPRTSEESGTVRPKRRTTLLYVMPSPSREEPPMVFPPFPPPYSDLQRRPSSNRLRCSYPPDVHSDHSQCIRQSVLRGEEVVSRPHQSGDMRRTPHYYLSRLFNRLFEARRRRRHRRNLEGRVHLDRIRAAAAQHSTRASAIICAGDRILQPVLIVEDSESITDPPSYSAIDFGAPID